MQSNTLVQIRTFAGLFLAPEAAAACVLLAFAARASIEDGVLVLTRGARRLELALRDIVAVEPWRVPIPAPGASLRLASGERWRYGHRHARSRRLGAGAGRGRWRRRRTARPRATTYAQARLADPARAPRPALGPSSSCSRSLLAIPAFRLHQHIAYGSGLGEYYTFGLGAYLTGFALWWAAWAIGVVLCAAALRAAIEAGTLVAVLLRPAQAIDIRRWLERLGLAALYLGLPAWLLLRIYSG